MKFFPSFSFSSFFVFIALASQTMIAVSLRSQLNSNQKRWNLNKIQANFVDHIVLHDWAYWCNLILQKLFYAYRATFDKQPDIHTTRTPFNLTNKLILILDCIRSSLMFESPRVRNQLSAMFNFSLTNTFNCYKVILFDFAPNKNENARVKVLDL